MFIISSCAWYKQFVVHIDALIVLQSTIILNPAILLRHNLLRLTVHSPRPSIRMPLAEANHSLSRPSIRMPLAEANHSFVPAIHPDAISRS